MSAGTEASPSSFILHPSSFPEEDLARLQASFPTPRHAVDYILDTFPIVRRKDEEKHGDYKPPEELSSDDRRKIAFTAAQSWGADQIFDDLFGRLVANSQSDPSETHT